VDVLRMLDDTQEPLLLVLWRVLRQVRLWQGVPAAERAEQELPLFVARRLDEARARAPELAGALEVFGALFRRPRSVGNGALADACQRVYEWAEMGYRLELAVCFAEAAASADPGSPARANLAARICRRAALHESAAQWYLRGFKLAVQAKDRDESLRALLGYGGLMYSLGKYDEARRFFERAATRAARTGRRRQAGEAEHDLLGIASDTGTYAEGERHATRALAFYPVRHPRIPHLVHDFAVLLLRHGRYATALGLLHRVLPLVRTPEVRVIVWSNLGYAAASLGQREPYEDARQQVLGNAPVFQEHAAAAMVNLARGARMLGEWEDAERYASQALALARARRDGGPEKAARVLLEELAARAAASLPARLPSPGRTDRLVLLLKTRLQQWAAPAHPPGPPSGRGAGRAATEGREGDR
jgi:tetratricopeptide (TPR) repeat protein